MPPDGGFSLGNVVQFRSLALAVITSSLGMTRKEIVQAADRHQGQIRAEPDDLDLLVFHQLPKFRGADAQHLLRGSRPHSEYGR